MGNTCVASIFFCIVQNVNYLFLIFLPWETSNIACRWRGYFGYMTICAVAYSYLIQGISRLFIAVLSTKYKWLTTFDTHYYLITLQWLAVFIIPLPAVVTKDIYFRPNALCWVPLKNTIHVTYSYVAYYLVPVTAILVIYCLIYSRVKRATQRALTIVRSGNSSKRDLELLRNILILLGIYFAGGIPTLLFLVTANRALYLIGIVTISMTVTVEKVGAIILDRDMRQVFRDLLTRRTQVTPFQISSTMGKAQEQLARTKSTNIQVSVKSKTMVPR